MASGAAAPAAVQTVVLRVSIHCQGCKKKVRKVLKSVEGVHNVAVDGAQHKVTVTGTVDADTLVRRLYKSGKQAALWYPGPAALEPEAKPAGDGGKDDAAAAAAPDKKPEEPVKEPQAADSPEKKPEQEAEKGTESTKEEEKEEAKPSGEAKKDAGEDEASEQKAKGGEPVKEPATAVAKEGGNDDDDAKKSKPAAKEAVEAEPAATAERSLYAPPAVAPKHAPYEEYHHPSYYAPQPVLSYHMAQPRASVSYYAPLPQPAYSVHQPPPPSPQAQQPMQQWSPSYLYMPYPHASPESYYRDHDYYSPPGTHAPPPPLQDSYRLFDDENPNSCSVM